MNRLGQETSPYLLQHAHNPVDWYAWKPEAFERAQTENKPILVSIGYSTCHWCHVMERESFENEDIAAFMNDRFVCIKVDREERPDVDAIYMDACQILTGGGGWPLNCFLTPEGKPFYAGTYFPPRPAHNRPSWLQLLQFLANIWETKPDEAEGQADRLIAHIQRNDNIFVSHPAAGVGGTSAELLYSRVRPQFDAQYGGFGGAPKFPSTMAIQFLLNYHHYSGEKEALNHALFSLDSMICGGIYDQLGGGFARYATDREWLVPHFEKMLYDNALLVRVLADAWKITGKVLYKEAIEETLEYIGREMTHPEGGFFAAQDADSEGVEGKFFVWDKSEIESILGSEADLFCSFYGVSAEGNWEEKNILWRPVAAETFALEIRQEVAWLKNRLLAARKKLFDSRENRVHPGLDDKVILGWNALMITAYVAAYTALGHDSYKTAAVRNLEFLFMTLAPPEPVAGAGLHVWKDGRAQYPAFLDDYAFFIAALIDVYEISFEDKYLVAAIKYTEYVLSYFQDAETGLFFMTESGQQDIIMRKKDLYDNATPSGNSTMALNFQRLGLIADRPDWREKARNMTGAVRESVEKYPLSFERWASAMLFETYPAVEIAVVGHNAEKKALALQQVFLPNKVVAAASGPTASWPLLAGKEGAEDALIYVCRDYACQQPVTTLEAWRVLVEPET
jgi:hypothetical protein